MAQSFLYTQPIMAIRALGSTLKVLLKQLFASLTGHNSRQKIDQLSREWSNELLQILDAKLTVRGQIPHYLPNQAYMIMSNHSTLFDIPIIFAGLPGSIRMIAKKELFKIPLFGSRIRDSEFISIDRSSPTRAHKDLKAAEMKMKDGIIIWSAPEGTRSHDGKLQAFKRGVFRLAIDTDAIIIPVGIQNGHKLLPARTWKFSPHQHIIVNIGEPIKTTDFSKQPDSLMMETVRNRILHLMESP